MNLERMLQMHAILEEIMNLPLNKFLKITHNSLVISSLLVGGIFTLDHGKHSFYLKSFALGKKWIYDESRNLQINSNESDSRPYKQEILYQVNDSGTIPGKQIRFEKISIEQGLSQSSVYSIYQDSRGYLWFGTEDGLNKYDGYDFTIYRHDPDDSSSLSDNTILSIFEDPQGELWVGTYGRGLNRFDRDTNQFTRYRHDPNDSSSLPHDTVNQINADSSGRLWVGTMDGLARYDSESEEFIHYRHDPENVNSLSHNVIMAIHNDSRGTLWVGTFGGGLNRYDPANEQFIRYTHDIINPHKISSNYVTSIVEDPAGFLWVGTADGGLNKFDPQSEEFYPYKSNPQDLNSLHRNSISALSVDQAGRIWIGSDGYGIDVFDPSSEQFQHYANDQDDPLSLSQDLITEAFVDSSGNVWIGTFGGGANKFDPTTTRFSHYRHIPNNPHSLSSNSVTAIDENADGDLWVGLFGGGLNLINRVNGEITQFRYDPNDPASISSDDVWSVYLDHTDVLWVGTIDGGLNRYDPATGEFTQYFSDPEDPNSLSLNSVNVIYEDRGGMLWIGTNGGGLNRFDRNTEKFFHFVSDQEDYSSLSNNQIWTIMEDRTGKLWVGTGGGGISVFDQQIGKFIQYRHDPDNPNSIGDTDVLSIYEDKNGVIWIGTYGSGLDKFDPSTETFIHYRVSDGLPNNVVYGILEDEEGYLWLSTNLGLSRFDPGSESFKNYDVSDGLQGNEFNVGAMHAGDLGELYFGGINGLTSFYPKDIQDTDYLPPVVLTAVKQGGENLYPNISIENLDQIVLDTANNNFEFEFVALNYSHPEKSQYAYILEGFDADWNYIGQARNGRYTNLPGGSYTLKLKATNSDGVWNEDGVNLAVKVIPPFWETWWFIGLITLIIMASVFTGYRLRIRSVEARSQALEDQVKSRTEEIDRRRLELEALYQADEIIDQFLTLENRLKALVDVAIDILNADKSSIFVWDDIQEKYVIQVSRGFSASAVDALSMDKDDAVIRKAAIQGEIVVVNDALTDSMSGLEKLEFVSSILAEGIRSFMFLPIKISGENFGVFNVNYCQPNAIGEDEKRVFMALTQHSALSIQNAQLFEQLRELAIKEERSRLARDLHDSAKQKAFAALAQLGAANGMLDKSPDAAKEHVLEAEELVHEVLQELIILIQEMYPVTLQEKGLASSVREYVFEWENQSDIETDVVIINEIRLPIQIEQSMYRVVQESLANVARHSYANRVDIKITYNKDSIEIEIVDDGIGFNINQKPTGLGLRSMDERVEMINGNLIIESEPGQGTMIRVVAPTGAVT